MRLQRIPCVFVKGYNRNRMIDFWSVTWGDIAAIAGIMVSLGGLGWAIKEARGARSASEAAKTAASETRDQIARHLQTVDLQRAIGLIERIKTLHDNNRWEGSTELYQSLREMLSDVISRCPDEQAGVREKLEAARVVVRRMENLVRRYVSRDIPDRARSRLNQRLNEIQSDLEELASSGGFGESPGETK